MPRECRIPSNFVTTFRKAIAHRSHRNRLPETASLHCAPTAAAASSLIKAKIAGQYKNARLIAVNRVNRVFFMQKISYKNITAYFATKDEKKE